MMIDAYIKRQWIVTNLLIVMTFFTLAKNAVAEERLLTDPIGHVIFSTGQLTATNTKGEDRSLKRGDKIFLEDTLKTGDGRAQIHFVDAANLSLRPNSELQIVEYYIDTKGKDDASVMKLLKGGFRTVTGAITKRDPDAYKVKTPVAVMSIRGTTYEAALAGGELGVEFIDGNNAIEITNAFGKVTLFKGGAMAATVSGSSAPQTTSSLPSQFKGSTPCS